MDQSNVQAILDKAGTKTVKTNFVVTFSLGKMKITEIQVRARNDNEAVAEATRLIKVAVQEFK